MGAQERARRRAERLEAEGHDNCSCAGTGAHAKNDAAATSANSLERGDLTQVSQDPWIQAQKYNIEERPKKGTMITIQITNDASYLFTRVRFHMAKDQYGEIEDAIIQTVKEMVDPDND